MHSSTCAMAAFLLSWLNPHCYLRATIVYINYAQPSCPKNKHKTLAALSHTRFNYCNHLHLLQRFSSTVTFITCTVSIQIKLNAELSKQLQYTAQLENCVQWRQFFHCVGLLLYMWVNTTTSKTVVLQTIFCNNDWVKLITTCTLTV